MAALEEACGVNKSKIKEMYNVVGDLGRQSFLQYLWKYFIYDLVPP